MNNNKRIIYYLLGRNSGVVTGQRGRGTRASERRRF